MRKIPVTDSPLRYPGGKTQLKKFIMDILNQLSLRKDINYVEPFAGGAGLALFLLINKKVERIYINDLDQAIYSFWASILRNTSEFISLIQNTPINLEEWHKQKNILLNKELHTELEVGFSTFYLNRTNVSGIIMGGPLGGKNQKSDYKIDCRFNKVNLIKKINKIAELSSQIHLSQKDAGIFINEEINKMDPQKTFIFFDPPYYHQGQNLYSNFYDHKDHVQLSKQILSLDQYYWITTYDYSTEIDNIYNVDNKRVYSLRYSANKVRRANELLIFSEKMIIPESENIQFIEK